VGLDSREHSKKRETIEENVPPAPILSRSEHIQRDVVHEPVIQTQHRELISTVPSFPVKGGHQIRGTNNFGVKGVPQREIISTTTFVPFGVKGQFRERVPINHGVKGNQFREQIPIVTSGVKGQIREQIPIVQQTNVQQRDEIVVTSPLPIVHGVKGQVREPIVQTHVQQRDEIFVSTHVPIQHGVKGGQIPTRNNFGVQQQVFV